MRGKTLDDFYQSSGKVAGQRLINFNFVFVVHNFIKFHSKYREMKTVKLMFFIMLKSKITLSFFCLIFVVNNNFAQLKTEGIQDSDPDTAWVSPNKSVPSFATYQIYPTPERGKGTFGSFMIYLPEEYKNTTNRYPVIYYLHGGNGNQREGQWLMNEMDKAIKAQKMSPVIIVSVQALPIGWYCNANVGAKGVISGPVENVLIKNLVPYIDAHYRTIAQLLRTWIGRLVNGRLWSNKTCF